MLGLNQRHALKTFRASVGDEEGHKADCILAREGEQPIKSGTINGTDYPWLPLYSKMGYSFPS